MRKFYREYRKNVYKIFYEMESGDYAVMICVFLVIGVIINLALKGGF